MIIDDKIKVKVSRKNIEYFKKFNIQCELKDIIEISPTYLTPGSHININVKCDICGNEKKLMYQKYVKNIKNSGIYTCSSKCAQEKVKKTSLERFGEEYYTKTKEYRDKCGKTSLEKYGTNHHSQNEKVKNKLKNTCLLKYGVDNPSKSEFIIDKIKNIFIEKYGVDNISKLPHIKKIISEKVNLKIKITTEKRNETILNKYNVQNVSQLDWVQDKIRQTNLKKIGVISPLLLSENRIKANNIKLSNWKNNKLNDQELIDIDLDRKLLIGKCDNNHIYEINYKTYYNRKLSKTMLCNICNPICKSTSGKELELIEFIKQNYDGEILTNNKSTISPYELDVYLPNLKVAFEFNGLYWHGELNKDKSYHLNKTKLCNNQDIQLIHIFEDDWTYKKDILKSLILNILNKIPTVIHSNQCELKEIDDNKIVKYFLMNNDIYGFINSSIKIGLFYKNELLSLMVFKKTKDEYKLLRFCCKINTIVTNSEIILFNYFINKYKPIKVTVNIDNGYENGNLYEKIGFKFSNKVDPTYSYIIDDIRHNKHNFKKSSLVKQGFDESKTESQIMTERKIYKIYNSGFSKFIYTLK